MLIKQLVLKNWGRHEKLEAQTDAAVMGLIGPNGMGKTTVLKALEFAFTGDLADRAETYVRGYGTEGGAANGSVFCRFSKDGVTGSIFRQVGKTAKRELIWDGKTIKAAAEVEKILAEILGADKAALANAVFISQGELDKILFGSQVERETLFAKLLLVGHLAKIGDYVKKKVKAIKDGLQNFGAVEDELRIQRVESEQTLHTLKASADQHPSYITEIGIISVEKAAAGSLKAAVETISGLRRTIADAAQRLSALCKGKPLADWKEEREEAQAAVAGHQQILNDVNWARSEYSAYDQLSQQKMADEKELAALVARIVPTDGQAATARLTTLNAELQLLSQLHNQGLIVAKCADARAVAEQNIVAFAANPAPDTAAIEQLTLEIEQAQRDLHDLQLHEALREQAIKCDSATCPVCGSNDFKPLEPKTQEITELCRRIGVDKQKREALQTNARNWTNTHESLQNEGRRALGAHVVAEEELAILLGQPRSGKDAAALAKELEDLKAATVLAQELGRQKTALEQSIHGYNISLERFTPEKVSDIAKKMTQDVVAVSAAKTQAEAAVSAADALIKAGEPLQKEITDAETLLSAESAREARAIAVLTDIRGKYTDLIKKLLADGKTLEDIEMVATQGEAEHQQHKGRIEAAEEACKGIVERQRELGRRMDAEQSKRALVADGERMAAIFERGGLPATYVRYRFEQLASLTRSYLAQMESDFSVDLDPETSVAFTFTRTDDDSGCVMEQNKLSGGQRVRLTVAFLLAVQKLIIPDVGFLILDEPSTHLDAASVESLRNLLTAMAEQLNNTDSQVWVCDHNPALMVAFGGCIQLG